MDQTEFAIERYRIIEPYLKQLSTLEEISKRQGKSVRTLNYWVAAFKKDGLTGLMPKSRNDKGEHRSAEVELVKIIQGLYLRTPPVPISTVYRSVQEICSKNNWDIPSYGVVRNIVLEIPSSLKTLAHEGPKAYKQEFGLLHRFEADRPNEIWQADHAKLDINVLDSNKRAVKPWLTVIIDDYSRAIPGYFIGIDTPNSVRIALALRQAIWTKEEENWTICGIPEKFYSDNGSDFVSKHIDQVAIDLKIETLQTEPNDPQGKGKCERFFRTVKDMFLSNLPGYAPKGFGSNEALLTVDQLDKKFRNWLTSVYLVRKHSETEMTPSERWESFPFVPRMPDSIEQLNHLLLTVVKERRVQRDGIRLFGYLYSDVELNRHITEFVTVRFDPRDLSQIHVYSNDVLVCKANCFELTGKMTSLKEVRRARNHEAKIQRNKLGELLTAADKFSPEETSSERTDATFDETPPEKPRPRIRRFACDKE